MFPLTANSLNSVTRLHDVAFLVGRDKRIRSFCGRRGTRRMPLPSSMGSLGLEAWHAFFREGRRRSAGLAGMQRRSIRSGVCSRPWAPTAAGSAGIRVAEDFDQCMDSEPAGQTPVKQGEQSTDLSGFQIVEQGPAKHQVSLFAKLRAAGVSKSHGSACPDRFHPWRARPVAGQTAPADQEYRGGNATRPRPPGYSIGPAPDRE